MIIRLRSRDGLERVEVPDDATLEDLRVTINSQLGVPLDEMHLSQDPKLLTSRDPTEFKDLSIAGGGAFRTLRSLGLLHGAMAFLWYVGEREVPSAAPRRSAFEARPFGAKLTLNDVMAKQMRIERQAKPKVEAVSFDSDAAGQFQMYLQTVTKFRVKRGGLLYGTYDEASSTVNVEFIYEPPQSATPTRLKMERHTSEEQEVDFLAQLLGMRKVGLIFSYAAGQTQEWIADTHELMMMAQVQSEVGPFGVTAAVSWVEEPAEEEGGRSNCYVHFEAFQCSEQCIDLYNKGWLRPRRRVADPSRKEGAAGKDSEPSDLDPDSDGVTKLVNPEEPGNEAPAMLNGKDVGEVDNDFFLCPVAIRNHRGPLVSGFAVENRLTSQSKSDLRDHLRRNGKRPYIERISDLHLLLWLSKQSTLDGNDMALLCEAVRHGRPVLEGYRAIIDSIAGL